MLARLLRPCQRRIPVIGGILMADGLLALAAPATLWQDPSWWHGLGLAALVALPAWRRPGFAIAIAGGIALSGLCAVQWGAARHLVTVMGLAAVIFAPLWLAVASTRARPLAPQDCDRALGLCGSIAHLAILVALPSGAGTAAALTVGSGCCLLTPGALRRRAASAADVSAANAAPQGLVLGPLVAMPALLNLRFGVLAGVAWCLWALRASHPLPPWQVTPGCLAVLAGVPVVGYALYGSLIGALATLLIPLLVVAVLAGAAEPVSTLLGILAPSAVIALAWRWWCNQRAGLQGWRMAAAALGVAALAVGVGPSPLAALLAGLATASLTAARWGRSGRSAAETVPAVLARCRTCLDMYWRAYLPMKWRLDPVFAQLAGDLRPWGAVLDIGCGPGLGALLCATRADCTAYCGIDLDTQKLEVARLLLDEQRRLPSAQWRLVQGSVPFSAPLAGCFDTILLVDVLHYWPEAQQLALLHYLRGSLRPHGELWLREGVGDPDGHAGRVGAGERFTTRFGLNPGGGELHFLTQAALAGLLEDAGFMVVGSWPSGAENRLWRAYAG